MGLLDIKLLSRMGLNPMILKTRSRAFAFLVSPSVPSSPSLAAPTARAVSFSGGKRAYEGRLKKDWSARQSRRSTACTKRPSPPFATFRLPAAMAAIRPVTPELPAGRNGLSFFQAIQQSGCLGGFRASQVTALASAWRRRDRRRSDAVEFGRLSSADDSVRPVGGPSIGRSAVTPFSHRTQRLRCDVKAFHERTWGRSPSHLRSRQEQPGRLCGWLLPQAIKRSARSLTQSSASKLARKETGVWGPFGADAREPRLCIRR